MKLKGISIITGLVAAMFLFSNAQAGQHMQGKGMMHGGSMMRGGSGAGMSTKCMGMGMMGGMMPRQIVAVDDGIIVVIGNKLVKYDKNLNMKKEVKLEMDSDDMKAMMQHMQKMHTMYWDMYEDMMQDKSDTED